MLEPEAFAAIRDWFSELGKSVHVVGPLLPDTKNTVAVAGETQQSTNGSAVEAFLDKTLQSQGDKSLLYVRLILCIECMGISK